MKKWEIQHKIKNLPRRQAGQKSKIKTEEIISIILKNRGLTNKKDIEAFLHPTLSDVTVRAVGINPSHLKTATERIKKAIQKQEQIVVFGDYDVDGITGSAILWETLNELGARVMPYIPNRMTEGYGLSLIGIDTMLEKHPETTLIITVDNGIVAHEAVTYANTKKIDVIITDHHTPSGGETIEYPPSHAVVHTTKLCGAGVAWLFTQQFKVQNAKFKVEEDNHLELAALGTIADLVPLTGANRTIVKYGLNWLCKTKRLGLLEIFRQAACDPSTLGVYQVGHIIAPRLNAAGRLASAMDSLRLLCTKDRRRAEELSDKLGLTNKERQVIMTEAAKHASNHIKTIGPLKKLLVVAHEEYQQGVIGLVAGRLVEEFYRPSIVISKGEKYSKASARSVSGFNVIEFLRRASDLLVDVGGHPMAAGFTVETDKIELLQKTLEDLAETMLHDDTLVRTLRVDCELPFAMANVELYRKLQILAPFGMGNPEPTFVSRAITISDMRKIGRDQNHLKFLFQGDMVEMEGIAFQFGDRSSEFAIGDTVDLVYTIDENTWNGNSRLQLKVKDMKQNVNN